MYKDYKKTESLDTGFVGGNGIIWMFSGIVLGLLVGLGMYYFSNSSNSTFSTVANVQQSIKAAQQMKVNTGAQAQSQISNTSTLKQTQQSEKPEKRLNKFSYYAVLPTLDVPVSTAKPIETRFTPAANTLEIQELQKKVALLNGELDDQVIIEEKTGDFLLQVASFRKKSKANLTKGRLAKRGVNAYIKKKKIKGRLWYRVLAGPVDQNSVDNWKQQAERLGHRPLVISVR